MKIELKSEKTNLHMKRKELMIEADHEASATPSRAALTEQVAKQFGYDAAKTDVRTIETAGGASRSKIKVFVWNEARPVKEKKAKEKKK